MEGRGCSGEGDVGMAHLPPQGQTQGPSLMDTRERMEVQRGGRGASKTLPPLSSFKQWAVGKELVRAGP